jgi:hypothetical protein
MDTNTNKLKEDAKNNMNPLNFSMRQTLPHLFDLQFFFDLVFCSIDLKCNNPIFNKIYYIESVKSILNLYM